MQYYRSSFAILPAILDFLDNFLINLKNQHKHSFNHYAVFEFK